ncbi:MAG TPA: AI-2E family transporter, partial [Firmicutes bacterium]|nr:AI-2E family transporter [Bacillota bacterium]
QGWIQELLLTLGLSADTLSLSNIQIDWAKLAESVSDFLQYGSTNLFHTTVGITTSIFSGFFNLILGSVFSIYLLLQKERLCLQAKKLLFAYLPEQRVHTILRIGSLSNKTFSGFVTGQVVEAAIIGILCFIGMKIFSMPYASMISCLVGLTALIPIFGAFIGTAIGAFLILMDNPMQAVWFILFIIILQQVEGNLIYPKVVGKSVGLPGIWVLTAITIGGSTFGIAGMLFSVPLCSVLYCMLKESVAKRLKNKKITVQEMRAEKSPIPPKPSVKK